VRWGQTRDFFRCRNNFLPRFLGLLTLGSLLTEPHLHYLTCSEACRQVRPLPFRINFQQSPRSLHFAIFPSRKVPPEERARVHLEPSTPVIRKTPVMPSHISIKLLSSYHDFAP
jgi:hypothetical protein